MTRWINEGLYSGSVLLTDNRNADELNFVGYQINPSNDIYVSEISGNVFVSLGSTSQTVTPFISESTNPTVNLLEVNNRAVDGINLMRSFPLITPYKLLAGQSYIIGVRSTGSGITSILQVGISNAFKIAHNGNVTISLDTSLAGSPDSPVSAFNRYKSLAAMHQCPLIGFSYSRQPITGKIKDQAPGTVINFAGSQWTILEPATGYLFKNESLGDMAFDPTSASVFNPNDTDNVGYYLNTNFYNQLSNAEKNAINSHDWGIGGLTNAEGGFRTTAPTLTIMQMKAKEQLARVGAKIGLLSVSEWRKYSVTHSGGIGILQKPASYWSALISPCSSNQNKNSWVIDGDGYVNYTAVTTPSIYPTLYIDPETSIVNGTVVHNAAPTLTLSTPNNATLYENDTLLIDGSAKDTDNNDIVNVRYQINNGTVVAIKTDISDGVSPIPFSRQLTFKAGKLHYNDVAITGALTEGTAHTLKVWSEDDKGGKSTIAERTFYVVPNRAPSLIINPFTSQSDLINADKITFTGSTFDPDSNDMVVSYKLNGGLATEVYRGKDGDWSFDLLLKDLTDGENTIVVETVDSYNFKTSLTRKLNKQANLTPLAKSVQRYTIVPPAGSAQGVLMWIERDETQSITAEISMTNGTEQEQFVAMTLDSTGPTEVGRLEDFFKFRADTPAEKIAIKLSWTGDKPIFKVSGALQQ